ncbi:hypothetical protein QA584_27000 [Anaerocolumna sp. AGMB13025]|uniref:hypothetical protein n=1 Tax=Anaerocolumna sp. AGMB13025 TaxID=3039116 RepID=UPI00241D0856|nr:hypothetical protein [Anaerocolumna sp. AGMB13025]WFR57212.1 hypothetical protein QA584_27000 [Anaerocolumna sp. AGMB13025]
MSTFKDMMERTTIQHLSHLIRDYKQTSMIYETFDKREEIADDDLYSRLSEFLSNEQIFDIEPLLNEYSSSIGEIYFNMGMKAGARLLHQLLDNEDRDY